MGNVSENFKNFELRFNDYCVQANYRDLAKDPVAERADLHLGEVLALISVERKVCQSEGLVCILVFHIHAVIFTKLSCTCCVYTILFLKH